MEDTSPTLRCIYPTGLLYGVQDGSAVKHTRRIEDQMAAQARQFEELRALLVHAAPAGTPRPPPDATSSAGSSVKSIPWSDLVEASPPIVKGKGSFGEVRLYDWTSTSMRVAVKELKTALAGHLSAAEAADLKREAALLVRGGGEVFTGARSYTRHSPLCRSASSTTTSCACGASRRMRAVLAWASS